MMWGEVQVTIVVSWWSIFGISPRVERGSVIIIYIGIHMIANYDFPPYLNIFIRYNDISVIMNSTLVFGPVYAIQKSKCPKTKSEIIKVGSW